MYPLGTIFRFFSAFVPLNIPSTQFYSKISQPQCLTWRTSDLEVGSSNTSYNRNIPTKFIWIGVIIMQRHLWQALKYAEHNWYSYLKYFCSKILCSDVGIVFRSVPYWTGPILLLILITLVLLSLLLSRSIDSFWFLHVYYIPLQCPLFWFPFLFINDNNT